ncbi:hypothetical protein [Virgibacillus ndiopensis]|uniref:hypothetical protein n=1 Tax=Virgibacillus ndiopensis TaxID=2004408 RepID=UPI00159BB0F4|nr:hypothetical protein [Virgibacillus ndiopensis]
MKQIKYDAKEVQNILANDIAGLKIQLANEVAAKNAIVRYAEELEQKLAKYEGDKDAE